MSKSSNKDSKDLFWKIYNSENENELHKIVQSDPLLSDPLNWKPYGTENNFSTFENQQSNSIAALVEKITNGIDALLMKYCMFREIDPKSNHAPATMQKAVELFYGIKDGNFSELLPTQRRTTECVNDLRHEISEFSHSWE